MSVWATNEQVTTNKINQKSLLVGSGLKLTNLSETFEGQLAYCTSDSGNFLKDKIYARLAGNINWSGNLTETIEQTLGSDEDGSSSAVTSRRFYRFLTLPSTEKFYIFTGITWRNGSGVAGNIISGIDVVNTDPPTIDHTPLVALAQEVAQAGTNQYQTVNVAFSRVLRGGTLVGVWIENSNSGATLKTLGAGLVKIQTYNPNPNFANNTAFSGTNGGRCVRAYYRGYS